MKRHLANYTLMLSMVFSLVTVGHTGASDYTSEDCIECHQLASEESKLLISVTAYDISAHGMEEITCMDCHTGVVGDEHQTIEGSGAVDCRQCHEQENQHGLNGEEKFRPQCHDCHTRHDMLTKTDPASSVHQDQLPTTCGECHPAATGDSEYFSWFPAFQIASHNKADFGSVYSDDNCLGCHQGAGAHGESEPINDQNCHRCHGSRDGAGAMWGHMHPQADRETQPIVFAAASIYQVFIVIGLILLLGKCLKIGFNRNIRASKG